MELKDYLIEANQHRYFTYLNGNDIPYLYNSFQEKLAYSNKASISKLEDLQAAIDQKKTLFGHFSYDLKNELHDLTSRNNETVFFPDVHFFEPEVIHDFYSIPSKKTNYIPIDKNISVKSRFSRDEYIAIIKKLRNHIVDGDCYEINFCIEFYAENVKIDPIQIYFELNQNSPMPFSAFHKVDNNYLICASPERFIKKEGLKLISQPIKGTSKKGSTKAENDKLKEELLASEKERAENLMIVDLVRNDLAMSATTGSVKVEELFGIYDFASVNQMISTISAKKDTNTTSLESILNAFPMGSMTGAPKHKVMQLIEKYERSKRGLYAGSIGYFDDQNNFDFNVVIRSIAYNKDTGYLSFQVGGAITYDSIPEQEYDECLLKASAIMKVLGAKLP